MSCITQNDLLLQKLMQFYNKDNNLKKMLQIINGESKISLRIVDWFVTNYSKKNYTVINFKKTDESLRIKIYDDYKLKLKAYSKKRFDPFCRWDRITIPLNKDTFIQTTIGQLNFFKWALEYDIINYIENNYSDIDNDMNSRNTNKLKNTSLSSNSSIESNDNNKTRKKREELSINPSRSIKKETLEVVIKLN